MKEPVIPNVNSLVSHLIFGAKKVLEIHGEEILIP